jgi:N-acetylmuramoyl-L-alanine amidase
MTFSPDTPLVTEAVPSPNFGERAGVRRPDLIVLHYTGMLSADAALARLCDPDAQVSAHYLVFEDGRIVQLVPEAARAWHAGVSYWAGERDINSHSVGIEIANPGHDYGYPDFPQQQIEAVLALCLDIARRNAISRAGLLAHSDVAPARKQDPGEKFPWRAFAEAGLGFWAAPAPLSLPGPALSVGSGGPEVAELRTDLSRFGYEAPAADHFDAALALIVAALQRHYRPERIDGVADASMHDTLQRLLVEKSRFQA